MIADDDEPVVRPFFLTRGRTEAHLPVEAMVVSAHRDLPGGLFGEYQAIFEMCRRPLAIAEIAAHLIVPLGVARVLVSDLADRSLVEIADTTTDAHADVDLLDRIISGVERL